MKCTIEIAEHDLRELIDFKIKSLQRALNTTTVEGIKPALNEVISGLRRSQMSINQLELPIGVTDKRTKP